MKRTDLVAGILVSLFGVYVVWQSTSLPYSAEFGRPGAGFFPFWLGMAAVLLGGVVAVGAARRPASSDIQGPNWNLRDLGKPFLILLAMLIAIVGLRTLGFLVTIGLFLAFLTVIVERVKPVPGLVTAVLGSLGFYLLFEVWLKVQLPIGILGI